MNLLRRLWDWVIAKPSEHPPGARLTRTDAERIASASAVSAPLWRHPLASEFDVQDGRKVWVVTANAHAKGATMWVVVDDATGQVVGQHERQSR